MSREKWIPHTICLVFAAAVSLAGWTWYQSVPRVPPLNEGAEIQRYVTNLLGAFQALDEVTVEASGWTEGLQEAKRTRSVINEARRKGTDPNSALPAGLYTTLVDGGYTVTQIVRKSGRYAVLTRHYTYVTGDSQPQTEPYAFLFGPTGDGLRVVDAVFVPADVADRFVSDAPFVFFDGRKRR